MNQAQDLLTKTIKESFDPRLISALYKNFSDQYIALLELIDNAVDDRILDVELGIDIHFEEETKKLTIKNVHGKGMDIEDLNSFFQWGFSKKSEKIGRYGQGGKAAIGYLAKSFLIKSYPMGLNKQYIIRVDNWEERDSGLKEFNIDEYDSISSDNFGKVSIEITNLKKSFNINTIKERIINTYRPLIMNKDVVFFVNTDELTCQKINYDFETKRSFNINFPIPINNQIYNINGEYGIVSDKNSSRGGFNIYHFGRRVGKKEYFGLTDPSKRWNVERLYGELYINFNLPLLMNKTDIDRDSPVWLMISNLVSKEIAPTLKQAIDYRAPTEKEEKVVKKLTQKVNQIETNKLQISLSNYGNHDLFIVDKDPEGNALVKINREHSAYKKWCKTSRDEELYTVMVYSLYSAALNMTKTEASKLLSKFADSLKNNSEKLL